jgi:hypothetical protein
MASDRVNKKFSELLKQLKETGVTKKDVQDYSQETLNSIKELHEEVARVEEALGKEHNPNMSLGDVVAHMDELFRELRNELADTTSKVSDPGVSEKNLKQKAKELSGENLSQEQASLMTLSKEPLKEMQAQTALLKKLVTNTSESDFDKISADSEKKDEKEGVGILGKLLGVVGDVGSTIGGGIATLTRFLTTNPLLVGGVAALGSFLFGKIADLLEHGSGVAGTAQANAIAEEYSISNDVFKLAGEDAESGVKEATKVENLGDIALGNALIRDKDTGSAATQQFFEEYKGMKISEVAQTVLPRTKTSNMRIRANKEGFPILAIDSLWWERANKRGNPHALMASILFDEGFISDIDDPISVAEGIKAYNDQFKIKEYEQLIALSDTRRKNMEGSGQIRKMKATMVKTDYAPGSGRKTKEVQGAAAISLILNEGVSSKGDKEDNLPLADLLGKLADAADNVAMILNTVLIVCISVVGVSWGAKVGRWGLFLLKTTSPKTWDRFMLWIAKKYAERVTTTTAAAWATKRAAGLVAKKVAQVAAGAALRVAAHSANIVPIIGQIISAGVLIYDTVVFISEWMKECEAAALASDIKAREDYDENYLRMVGALSAGEDPGGLWYTVQIGSRTCFAPYHTAVGVVLEGEADASTVQQIAEMMGTAVGNYGNLASDQYNILDAMSVTGKHQGNTPLNILGASTDKVMRNVANIDATGSFKGEEQKESPINQVTNTAYNVFSDLNKKRLTFHDILLNTKADSEERAKALAPLKGLAPDVYAAMLSYSTDNSNPSTEAYSYARTGMSLTRIMPAMLAAYNSYKLKEGVELSADVFTTLEGLSKYIGDTSSGGDPITTPDGDEILNDVEIPTKSGRLLIWDPDRNNGRGGFVEWNMNEVSGLLEKSDLNDIGTLRSDVDESRVNVTNVNSYFAAASGNKAEVTK